MQHQDEAHWEVTHTQLRIPSLESDTWNKIMQLYSHGQHSAFLVYQAIFNLSKADIFSRAAKSCESKKAQDMFDLLQCRVVNFQNEENLIPQDVLDARGLSASPPFWQDTSPIDSSVKNTNPDYVLCLGKGATKNASDRETQYPNVSRLWQRCLVQNGHEVHELQILWIPRSKINRNYRDVKDNDFESLSSNGKPLTA